ncbi:hypothetical protein [Sphingobium sp. WCS2017Hpa-17]|uniref:hypothetical protein n=1 Tax=Sphingobium sp. WCS2017Hpa-17 TaxID=3073638 RepID=UPI00288B00DD|nr:hypothetical protein [Sphingobium sp. WCS2017Hpa-17]
MRINSLTIALLTQTRRIADDGDRRGLGIPPHDGVKKEITRLLIRHLHLPFFLGRDAANP